jgi:hypothetical protein
VMSPFWMTLILVVVLVLADIGSGKVVVVSGSEIFYFPIILSLGRVFIVISKVLHEIYQNKTC